MEELPLIITAAMWHRRAHQQPGQVVTLLLRSVTLFWGPSVRLHPPPPGRLTISPHRVTLRTSGCARHPQGTCSLGTGPRVTPSFSRTPELWGAPGLRQCPTTAGAGLGLPRLIGRPLSGTGQRGGEPAPKRPWATGPAPAAILGVQFPFPMASRAWDNFLPAPSPGPAKLERSGGMWLPDALSAPFPWRPIAQ